MNNSLISALFTKGALIDLDIGRWAGTKKLDEEDLLLNNVNPDAVYLGHKKLLPKSSLSKIVEKEQKARSSLLKLSSHFPVSGTRFATFTMLPQIMEKLDEIGKEWVEAVDIFLNEYESNKDKQLEVLNNFHEKMAENELEKTDQANKLGKQIELKVWLEGKKTENQKLYPSKEVLATKFSFTWRIFKIEPIDGKMEVKALAEAQSKLEADLKAWVQEACASMHKTLGEAAAHASFLLEKQGKLNSKNLKPLFDAFEVFSNMDFVGSNFKTTIDSIKAYTCVDGKTLNPETDWKATSDLIENNKDGFKNLLNTLGKLAVEEAATAAGITTVYDSTEFKRFVEL